MKVYLVSYIIDETKPYMTVNAMVRKVDIQHNKLMQLENSIIMYGVCYVETLEKLITTVHNIHNTTSSHEKLLQDNIILLYLEHFMHIL